MENGSCQIRCRDLELKGNNRSQGQAAEGCWSETELRCTFVLLRPNVPFPLPWVYSVTLDKIPFSGSLNEWHVVFSNHR
jgi:hypothetical protein